MKATMLAAVALGTCVLALGCHKKDEAATTSPASASASAATTAATLASAAPTAKAATSAVKPAETSAAATFAPLTLPMKGFTDCTIALPPTGKLEKSGGDAASLETPDYRIMIKPAKKNETADMKAQLPKMPGFKEITVDTPDGIIAHVEDKGAQQYVFTRYVKVGDKLLSCESALTKPAKDKAKAQEAFDVCGTIKKK